MRECALTQQQPAELLGAEQADVLRLLQCRVADGSFGRLFRYLNHLDTAICVIQQSG